MRFNILISLSVMLTAVFAAPHPVSVGSKMVKRDASIEEYTKYPKICKHPNEVIKKNGGRGPGPVWMTYEQCFREGGTGFDAEPCVLVRDPQRLPESVAYMTTEHGFLLQARAFCWVDPRWHPTRQPQ